LRGGNVGGKKCTWGGLVRALARLGEREQARAVLHRAGRLAGEHGLPHVLRDVREAEGGL
jgi:hypothetical protein